jgi:ABC-type transporter MlaC component|tara:strand:+ start:720 stop:884 length:165 start_codon:yes stop_codon:yes gene_type:complete
MKTIKKLTTIFGLTLIIFLVGCATVKETTVEEVVIEPVEKEYDDLFGIPLIYLI